jgi:hypothetical protein
VRFDTVAYPVNDPTYPGLAVTAIGAGGIFDPGRTAARAAVQAHATNVNGSTSIGAGVALGRSTVSPVTGFQDKALIVFTDGLENTPPMIADVLGDIDQRTFAIGLGNAQQVSTAALTALTHGTGGYLLLTGLLSTSADDYFRLSKYFLQILAGVTSTDIVLDPTGFLPPGVKVRIPFAVSETDIESTVLLLTDIPAVRFALETPGGDLVTPATAAGAGSSFSSAGVRSYYRHTLPLALADSGPGTWHAVLELDEKLFDRYCGHEEGQHGSGACARGGARYSLSALAWSNLRLRATAAQSSLTPGATLTVTAVLDEYGVPVDHRATVTIALTDPAGATATIGMTETQPGRFEAATVLATEGVYLVRVMASGLTFSGAPFTREQTLTAAVFVGGDQPLPTTPPKQPSPLCCIIESLTETESVIRFLDQHGLNATEIRKAIGPLHGRAEDFPQSAVPDLSGTGRACRRPGVGDGSLDYREPRRHGQSRIQTLARAAGRRDVGCQLASGVLECGQAAEREFRPPRHGPSPGGHDLAERPTNTGQILQQELGVMAGDRQVLDLGHRRSSPARPAPSGGAVHFHLNT